MQLKLAMTPGRKVAYFGVVMLIGFAAEVILGQLTLAGSLAIPASDGLFGFVGIVDLLSLAAFIALLFAYIRKTSALPMFIGIVLICAMGYGGDLAWQEYAALKRQATYETTLATYRAALKPGMTRKQVEDYLHAHNVEYGQTCCVAQIGKPRHSWDDTTKIGVEAAPWFCSEIDVFIGFEFSDYGPEPVDAVFKNDDLDVLRSVAIERIPGGCL